jgi:Trk-type K+ transport system membrane component
MVTGNAATVIDAPHTFFKRPNPIAAIFEMMSKWQTHQHHLPIL